MKPWHLGALVLLAGLGVSSQCLAQTETSRPRGLVEAVRLILPYYAYTSINGGRRTEVNIFGIAGGATLDELWSFELGFTAQGGASEPHFTDTAIFARFGVTPLLLDSEDLDGAWTLRGGPWLGYRLDRRFGRVDDYDVSETVHSVSEELGLELTRWWPSQVGLDILVSGGLVLPLSRSEDANWSSKVRSADDFHHGFGLRAEVGTAF